MESAMRYLWQSKYGTLSRTCSLSFGSKSSRWRNPIAARDLTTSPTSNPTLLQLARLQNSPRIMETGSSSSTRLGGDSRSAHVVAISGTDQNALQHNRLKLLEYLRTKRPELQNLAYSTTVHQQHHDFRAARSSSNIDELIAFLEQDQAGAPVSGSVERKEVYEVAPPISGRVQKGNVVFVFTGSAAQFDGMGKQLFESSAMARQLFQQHDDICKSHNLPSFIELITQDGKSFKTASLVEVQLATVSFEIVMASLWQHWGIKPDAVTGFSLGQYPALVVSGVISLGDMFMLVGKRSEMMAKECTVGTHAMVTTFGATETQIKALLHQMPDLSCNIACISGPTIIAVCGIKEDIHILSGRLGEKGIKVFPLDVPYAFHSEQVDPILSQFQDLAETVSYAKPLIPYASTLLGSVIVENGIIGAKMLADQTRQIVDMASALQALRNGYTNENTTWIECGPQGHILLMIANTLKAGQSKLIASSAKNQDAWRVLSSAVAQAYNNGLDFDWENFHEGFAPGLTRLDVELTAEKGKVGSICVEA